MSKRQTSQRRTRLWQDSERTAGSFFAECVLKNKYKQHNKQHNKQSNLFSQHSRLGKNSFFRISSPNPNPKRHCAICAKGFVSQKHYLCDSLRHLPKMPQRKRLLSYQRQPTAVQSLAADTPPQNVVVHSA